MDNSHTNFRTLELMPVADEGKGISFDDEILVHLYEIVLGLGFPDSYSMLQVKVVEAPISIVIWAGVTLHSNVAKSIHKIKNSTALTT